MTFVPTPDEEPRCHCGARLTEPKRPGQRASGQCRKCRARARWERREQARYRRTAGRTRSAAVARRNRGA